MEKRKTKKEKERGERKKEKGRRKKKTRKEDKYNVKRGIIKQKSEVDRRIEKNDVEMIQRKMKKRRM